MPKGPPPYPVTYKEYFITDPKTGKQTMKIQMYPSQKKNDEEEANGSVDSDDEDEIDMHHLLDLIRQAQHEGYHYGDVIETPYGLAIPQYSEMESYQAHPYNPDMLGHEHVY